MVVAVFSFFTRMALNQLILQCLYFGHALKDHFPSGGCTSGRTNTKDALHGRLKFFGLWYRYGVHVVFFFLCLLAFFFGELLLCFRFLGRDRDAGRVGFRFILLLLSSWISNKHERG